VVVLIWLLVIGALAGLTVWSGRRARRRILASTSEGDRRPVPDMDPRQAANVTRATIDATNSGGWL
jgi:hypothetical protein